MTALMELIVRLRLMMEDLPSGSNRALGLATAMDLASDLKQMERGQIEEAFTMGQNEANHIASALNIPSIAHNYFTQNYGQK